MDRWSPETLERNSAAAGSNTLRLKVSSVLIGWEKRRPREKRGAGSSAVTSGISR